MCILTTWHSKKISCAFVRLVGLFSPGHQCSMVRRFPKVGIYVQVPRPVLPQKRQHFATRSFCAVTLPLSDLANTWNTGNNPRDIVRRRKYDELCYTLLRYRPSPSRVWNQYKDLHMLMWNEQLPLQVHQAVLRMCTPSNAELRFSAARRILARNAPKMPHLHEERFRTIIRNIRAAGYTPALDDYHFILEQFAAVGHHRGSMHVYSELTFLGLEPLTRTYGLCLQAVAHRLSLPCSKSRRPFLIREATKMLDQLLVAMSTNNTRFTSVNLDLSIRILKESCDYKGFESLLKLAYGIDLSYPDRVPLDYADLSGEIRKLPARQPFSTAALNTTIDTLGRLGHIPKLVQAFEVLTQPLPEEASAHFSSSFDDDDDFGPSIAPPSAEKYRLPHATPNTTTYNLLIKYLSQAGHATFSRHYLKQAIYADHIADRTIRGKISHGEPLEQIVSPNFAINRGTLLPVFGLANRSKNVPLMKRLVKYTRRLRWRKKMNIIFYSDVRKKLKSSSNSEKRDPEEPTPPESTPLPTSHSGDATLSSTPDASPHSDDGPPTENSASAALPSSGDSQPLPWQTDDRTPKETPSIFDLDLDTPSTPPPPFKYFDLNLHLGVLKRDLTHIDAFYKHIELVYTRTIHRMKERLGRRVWKGRDIWLRDQDKRVILSRMEWRKIVRFRLSNSRSGTWQFDRDPAPHLINAPGSIASHRGFATMFIRRRELSIQQTS